MASQRRGLGRGLEALIPTPEPESGIREVPVGRIRPNPSQPRHRISSHGLEDLAASIRAHGVVQPLVARPDGEEYVLVAGERRWRAAQLAGLPTVPVLVRDTSPDAQLAISLVENLQREDLNPLDVAQGYRELADRFGMTQQQIAELVGKSRAAVANVLRLLRLPPSVLQALLREEIREGHARALLALPDRASQERALRQVVKRGLSVRQTEALVRGEVEGRPGSRSKPAPLPPLYQTLQEGFQRALGTKVLLHHGRKGGRVVIHYYSDEELQAIFDAIVRDSDAVGGDRDAVGGEH